MKAVLPYDAPPSIRAIVAAADRSIVEIVRLAAGEPLLYRVV